MGRLRRVCLFGAVVYLLSGTAGCGRIGVVSTDIAALQADPRAYEGRIVEVSGVVTVSANLFLLRCFRLEDGTGKIWVRTHRAVPQPGRRVVVRGRVRQVLAVGQFSFTILDEGAALQWPGFGA